MIKGRVQPVDLRDGIDTRSASRVGGLFDLEHQQKPTRRGFSADATYVSPETKRWIEAKLTYRNQAQDRVTPNLRLHLPLRLSIHRTKGRGLNQWIDSLDQCLICVQGWPGWE